MQAQHLDQNTPNAFILVPNAAYSPNFSGQDQVWALNLECNDPYPFCLHTTYGLRANSMRVFPNFIINKKHLSKPTDFIPLPNVTWFTPSSLQIEMNYRDKAVIKFTCFFPEPEVLIGCIQIINQIHEKIDLTTRLASILVPMAKGVPSHPDKSGNNQFITGKTANLEPVLFMTGGPIAVSSPFTALSKQLSIDPQSDQVISWVLVSKESKANSLQTARQIIKTNWQEELQSHRMHFEEQLFIITTGNLDWDSAIFLSQVSARTHLYNTQNKESKTHFVKIRLPDKVSNLEEIQSTARDLTNLDLYYFGKLMLPAEPNIILGLLEKLVKQEKENLKAHPENKFTSVSMFSPGVPMLSSILLEIYEINQDINVLKRFFQDLNESFRAWVHKSNSDSTNDKIVLQNPEQLQIDEGLYTYDIWEPYGKGLDIKNAESPALYAFLIREAKALYKIAKILGDRSSLRFYNHWQKELEKILENCWHENKSIYSYQDIQSHLCPQSELIFSGFIKDYTDENSTFSPPQRLQCHIFAADARTRNCAIKISGKANHGIPVVEIFKAQDILWISGRAHLTTKNLFEEIVSASFTGLSNDDHIILETADFNQCDISCFLPLWADAGSQEHHQKLIETWFEPPVFDDSFGIPETWSYKHALPDDLPQRINILWNTLIIEGLTRKGYAEIAADLFSNLMDSIIKALKNYKGFYPLFDGKTGRPIGSCNDIAGLVPIQTFLKLVGIKILSPQRVAIWGKNPFSWPVEIHWKGLSLQKTQAQTKITFPNGSTAEHQSVKPVLVTSEES